MRYLRPLLLLALLCPLALGDVPPKITIKIDGVPLDLTGKKIDLSIDATVPSPSTTTVTGGTFVYDGQTHPATGTVTGVAGVSLGSPTISYRDAQSATSSIPPSNAGTYTVTGSFPGNANYLPSSGTASLDITQATPTVAVTGGTFSFDSQPHPATGLVTGVAGANLGAPTFVYTDAQNVASSSAPVNAGTYTVKGSFSGTANYKPASGTATITITAPPPPPPPPGPTQLRHPLETVNVTTTEAKRFLLYAGPLVSKAPNTIKTDGELFALALAYKITGDVRYGQQAAKAAAIITGWAESQHRLGITSGTASFDSHLYVGEIVQGLCATLAWCKPLVDPAMIPRIEMYARQAAMNVRETGKPDTVYWWDAGDSTLVPPRPAGFVAVNRADSTWAIGNTQNNYFYSFLTAYAWWALYSGDQDWLDYVRKDRIDLVTKQLGQLVDGGSAEGTGYGSAQFRLFEVFALWKASTGEDISALSPHCRKSLLYWPNACAFTSGGIPYMMPIGDQARDSTARFYDYGRAVLLWGIYLSPTSPEAETARWFLAKYPKMADASNSIHDMLAASVAGTATAPTNLRYDAARQAHYFARSGWGNGDSVLNLVGAYTQGHAHHEVGAFNLWDRGWWMCCKANNWSNSGLVGATDEWWQNMLTFTKAGVVIKQQLGKVPTITITDDDTAYVADMDLSAMYATAGLSWKRKLTYVRPAPLRPTAITAEDTVTLPVGHAAQANYFLISNTAPVTVGNVTTTDRSKLTVETNEPVAVRQLSTMGAAFSRGTSVWRANIQGVTTTRVKLEGL